MKTIRSKNCPKNQTEMYFLRMRQSLFFFFFCAAGKNCFSHALRQLIRDFKSDVRTISFISDVTCAAPRKTPKIVRKKSLCNK